jgi:hypothetical protein
MTESESEPEPHSKKEMIQNPLYEHKKTISETEKIKIMKDIELKTEKIIDLAYKSGKITNPLDRSNPEKTEESCNLFQSIMKEGAKEFENKTGRQMSYSEMRQMYG